MTTVTDPQSDARYDALPELADLVSCRVLTPGDADYPSLATPWNVAAASTPAAVVEVNGPADVAATVRFAAARGFHVAVQCTGHGAVAYTRPTLLVHTRLLNELDIRPEGSARVGAGIRWEQVLEAAAPHGLAGLAGSAPDVGVVGYLTGGGLSPVARTYGYASDHVTAFDVVTGDGEVRRATASENSALFWGLRGGKGSLGIVTAVEFNLMPVREIYGGCLYFDGADASTVLHAWRGWSQTLPEAASTSLAILRLPEMPMVPPPLAGRCTVAVRFAWIGAAAEGEQAIAPMRGVAPVLLGETGVMPFAALGSIHADPVDPMPVHERFTLLRELSEGAAAALLQMAGPEADCPQVIVEMRQMGGAIARIPQPSAVCHRDSAFTLFTIGIAAPPIGDAVRIHAEELMSAMEAWSTGNGQPNFSPSADPATAVRNYDQATLERLGSLSRSYDPAGVLAASHGIREATAR